MKMYTVNMEGRKGAIKTFSAGSFSEIEDWINNNWDDHCDYWVSHDDSPAMEIRDLYSAIF